jgi:hypothetical protein
MKRTKRVHVEGWLHVFTTEPIMERVARYLDTRELFPFLLAVSKVLRDKATKKPRWNRIMQYGARIGSLYGVLCAPSHEGHNMLGRFLKRLYTKNWCSFCFSHAHNCGGVLRERPGTHGRMWMCIPCGERRRYVLSWREIGQHYCPDDDHFVDCPMEFERPIRTEEDFFGPAVYHRDELYFVPRQGQYQGKVFCVVDREGRRLWADVAD